MGQAKTGLSYAYSTIIFVHRITKTAQTGQISLQDREVQTVYSKGNLFEKGGDGAMWQQWVNGVLGLWILLSAFLNLTAEAMMWNLIIVGIAVAVLGFWGATQRGKNTPTGGTPGGGDQ